MTNSYPQKSFLIPNPGHRGEVSTKPVGHLANGSSFAFNSAVSKSVLAIL